ncbi:MAG: 30S ribosomal protein S17 [Dehalococcoidia bacterium]
MAKGRQKVRVGRVVSGKMDQTVVVAVAWQRPHPLYKKSVRRITRLYAHDGENTCRQGDLVKVEETRPLSKLKRWRVVQVLERGPQVEVTPQEIGREILEEKTAEEAPQQTPEEKEE